MAKFAYNNIKNTNTGHILLELNYGYHSKVLFGEKINPHLKSYSADKLAEKLKKLIEVYCQNLLYIQKLQKKAYTKRVKSHSYTPDKKVWLNSKYIKIKKYKKLENKFFGPF